MTLTIAFLLFELSGAHAVKLVPNLAITLFSVTLIQQSPLQLLHMREDSSSAVSAEHPGGPHGSFEICCAFPQSQPAKDFQARGFPTVLYALASPATWVFSGRLGEKKLL